MIAAARDHTGLRARLRIGSTALVAALLLALILLWPQPAAAQGTFVCPNGPGPGERQVGMTGGGNGVAAVPVCVADGPSGSRSSGFGGYAPPPVQMQAIDNFYAAAWHASSNNAWVAAGFRSRERAAQAALAACNQVMGRDCTLADNNVNGTFVVGRGVTGDLYSASRGKKREAEQAMQDFCRSKNDECLVVNSITMTPGSAPVGSALSEQSEIFPPPGNPRRQFGAIAWVDGTKLAGKPWTGEIWGVAGRPTAEAAGSEAQASCQRDYGSPCVVAIVASDVFIAVADKDGKSVSAASGATPEMADRRALANCRKTPGKCRIATTLGLAQNWSGRFDPFVQDKPYFTAQAWVRGAANTIWTISGAKSEAAAKQAALTACQREVKAGCEIASNSFNSLVALFADDRANSHVLAVAREADPTAKVRESCAGMKVTCRVLKVVDARVAAQERIDTR